MKCGYFTFRGGFRLLCCCGVGSDYFIWCGQVVVEYEENQANDNNYLDCFQSGYFSYTLQIPHVMDTGHMFSLHSGIRNEYCFITYLLNTCLIYLLFLCFFINPQDTTYLTVVWGCKSSLFLQNISQQARMCAVLMNSFRGCGLTRWDAMTNEVVYRRCSLGVRVKGGV